MQSDTVDSTAQDASQAAVVALINRFDQAVDAKVFGEGSELDIDAAKALVSRIHGDPNETTNTSEPFDSFLKDHTQWANLLEKSAKAAKAEVEEAKTWSTQLSDDADKEWFENSLKARLDEHRSLWHIAHHVERTLAKDARACALMDNPAPAREATMDAVQDFWKRVSNIDWTAEEDTLETFHTESQTSFLRED
jgi:hypothetical protein